MLESEKYFFLYELWLFWWISGTFSGVYVRNIFFRRNPFHMLLLYILASGFSNWSERSFKIGLVVSILVKNGVFCMILVDFDGCGYAHCSLTAKDSLESFCM